MRSSFHPHIRLSVPGAVEAVEEEAMKAVAVVVLKGSGCYDGDRGGSLGGVKKLQV